MEEKTPDKKRQPLKQSSPGENKAGKRCYPYRELENAFKAPF